MAMNPNLMALAAPPSAPAGGGGGSPFPAPPKQGALPGDGDAEVSSLGQLAMAFKEATDPRDAAAFLLEFLEQAGVPRNK